MRKGFICPIEEKHTTVDFETCLKKCVCEGCFVAGRCLSIRTLRKLSIQREVEGFSTTQLLNGTRLEFLKHKYDYFENPKEEMFRMLGDGVHSALENQSDGLQEIRLEHDGASGKFDFFDDETGYLYDTKTYGSYKAIGVIGIELFNEEDGVYLRGPKKGMPKYKKVPRITGKQDCFELEMQMNHYRMMLENQGFKVNKMFCEIIVRDGGTFLAKSRGITENAYLAEIKIIDNAIVNEYFCRKLFDIETAIEKDELPPRCNDTENWNGRRCKDYCPVNSYCDHYAMMMQNGEQDEE